ncbi:MAG: hypothetical protein ACI9EP_001590, partial [Oceanospirillaceae bacterium]
TSFSFRFHTYIPYVDQLPRSKQYLIGEFLARTLAGQKMQ